MRPILRRQFAGLVAVLSLAAGVRAQEVCVPNALSQTFFNPAPEVADAMGFSVALSDTRVVAGAPYDSPGGVSNAGSAYVFDRATGDLVGALNNPDPGVDDFFGWSVAIKGTIAVVGAWQDDPIGAPPAGAGGGVPVTNAGAAYVFDVTTGDLLLTLTRPVPAANDAFGRSVAMSDSSNVIVVGADWSNSFAGSAYVFNAATGAHVSTLSNPTPVGQDLFGWSVALSGNLAVVGAYGKNIGGVLRVGEAYVFNATTGELVSTLVDPVPDQDDYFGMSVAISGDTALVGAYGQAPGDTRTAGTAYVFNAATGMFQRKLIVPTAEVDNRFGNGVAIEGGRAVIGGYGSQRQAAIFDVGGGAVLGVIDAPQPFQGGFFGESVAIHGDFITTGAHYEDFNLAGTAYLFACPPPPTPSPTETESATSSPTPIQSPTPTPTPVGTPIISFDILIGYRPANDHGRGYVEFTDSDPSPDLRSYVVEFRRTNRFGVIYQEAFTLDGPPGASETRSTEFNLPLNEAGNPLSYEADLQYRVVGHTGPNGTGFGLYQSQLAYAKHPSARLNSSITFTSPPVGPGSEPFSMTDDRPTAQIGVLQYDIVRTVPGVEGGTVLATLDHGNPGAAIVAKVWPAATRTGAVPVVAGPQIITIHARGDFKDSAGGVIGRFDVAPSSPPLAVGNMGPLALRIADYLRTGAGDTTGLDANGDGAIDVADLAAALAAGL